jgi:hypothetical protein
MCTHPSPFLHSQTREKKYDGAQEASPIRQNPTLLQDWWVTGIFGHRHLGSEHRVAKSLQYKEAAWAQWDFSETANLVFNGREARPPAPREVNLVRRLGLFCAPGIGLPDRGTLHGCWALCRRLQSHQTRGGIPGIATRGKSRAGARPERLRGQRTVSPLSLPERRRELDIQILLLEPPEELVDEVERSSTSQSRRDAREDFKPAPDEEVFVRF